MKKWQDNITFILVEPEEQGNIGASARAIFNMGFKSLALINPPKLSNEAYWFAHNSEEVLEKALVFDDLKDALKDKSIFVCTTRRYGKNRGLFVSPWEAAKTIYQASQIGKVAVVFGRESKGLYNDEVNECGLLVTIPSSKKAPSLNLSHAVMIMAYEIVRHSLTYQKGDFNFIEGWDFLANQMDIETVFQRLDILLSRLDYGKKGTIDMKQRIVINFRRIFNRAGLTNWEVDMFLGLISRILEKVK
ncbi:MAG: RNA methyltransferase [Thermodesulfovibrionales bacterium]|nr:RNA methyltransferase [Thermodesulfovibrionales bacterium]